MTIVTLYALLGDDLRLLLFPIGADPTFLGLTIFAMFLFTAELILSSIGYLGYFKSFFFWLDLISTISLLSDIEPLMVFIIDLFIDDDSNSDSVTQATRGARLARVVRLIRLVRVVKLYKTAKRRRQLKEEKSTDLNKSENLMESSKIEEIMLQKQKTENMDDEKKKQAETKVGKKLGDKINQRVIVLVLTMLFSVPFFTVNNYILIPNSFGYGLNLIQELGPSSRGGQLVFK